MGNGINNIALLRNIFIGQWRKNFSQSSLFRVQKSWAWEGNRRERVSAIGIFLLMVFTSFAPSTLLAEGARPDKKIFFNIPQQRADLALVQFAEQADLTFVFPFEEARKETVSVVIGEYTRREALIALLSETSLRPEITETDGVLSVRIQKEVSNNEGIMSRKSLLSRLAAGVSSIVVGAAANGGAVAQDSLGDTASENRDVVIVTARKREENLQDVPISITAISQDALREANAFGLEDIAELTPGLTFRNVNGFSEPTIRGLALQDQLGLQANVGVFIDGVFLNNRSSIEFNNLDLAQVEVLKGPQSALFGRNTFAGAINYTTRGPSIGEFDATIEGEAGSHGRLGARGSVNLPISDFAAIRVFGGSSKFEGTITNERGGEDLGGWDERTTYGASALLETGRFRLKGFYARNEINEDQPGFRSLGFRANNAGNEYVSLISGEPNVFTFFSGDAPTFDSVDVAPEGQGNVGHYWLAYGNLDVDLDIATLTLNYSHSESSYRTSFDNTGDPDAVNRPFFGIYTAQFFTNYTGDLAEQDSYEVRLTSNEDSPFDWLIGYSHFDSVTGSAVGTITPLFADPSTLEAITNVTERLNANIDAIYASFSVPVSDRLNVSGEIRYTDEGQVVFDEAQIFFFPAASRPSTSKSAGFEFWSGRASLDYQIADDIMVYGYAARGVKSGGINFSGGVGFETFDPETNWTYEAGVKASLWDGRAVVNAALYYIDWTDLQANAPATLDAGDVVVNGIGASSKGIELDASIDVTEKFNLRFATAINDPKYADGFLDASIEGSCVETPADNVTNVLVSTCSNDVSGNQIARTSNFQLFVGGTYTEPDLLFGLDGYVGGNFSHKASAPDLSLNLLEQGAANVFNIRIGLRKDDMDIAFWADNVLDAEYAERLGSGGDFEATQSCPNCGARRSSIFPANGRTWGFKVLKRF